MSVQNTRPSSHQDQDAAIFAVVPAVGASARGRFRDAPTPIDAGRAFLALRRPDGDDRQQSSTQNMELNMLNKRPQPPLPDRIRFINGSFSWIDHRFLRQGFDQGLTRLEKLFYFVLIAVSNQDGVSFYSDDRLGEVLDIRHGHELLGARSELAARDLIAFKEGIYQVLALPTGPQRQRYPDDG
jgi:hypothetical protein